jgi:protein TonB
MAMPGYRKSFLKALSISAAAHITAVAALLSCLAPFPPALLPFADEDRGLISVSLVGGFAAGEKSRAIMALSRPEKRQASRAEDIRETKTEPAAGENVKNGLTGRKIELSYAALDVYTNGHSTLSDSTSGRPERAPGSGSANGAAAVAVSENVRAPVLIPAYRQNNPPRYPAAARLRGCEGLVLVSAEILADGTVGNIKLKRSSGHASLDDSAVEAVRKWLFHPGRRMGTAVPMWVDVPIRFALNE